MRKGMSRFKVSGVPPKFLLRKVVIHLNPRIYRIEKWDNTGKEKKEKMVNYCYHKNFLF